MSSEREWFYMLAGTREGPATESAVRAMMSSAVIDGDALVWTAGMPDWGRAAQVLPAYVGQPGSLAIPEGGQFFYPVSVGKFVTMSTMTFGLYEIYWSYRGWRYIREVDQRKVRPFWRAWFVLFWHYELLKTIKARGASYAPITYSAGWLTVAYFGLLVSSRLPDPWWLVSIVTFLPLLPVVRAVNAANETSAAMEANSRFSAWDIAGIVAGGLWWALVAYGYFGA